MAGATEQRKAKIFEAMRCSPNKSRARRSGSLSNINVDSTIATYACNRYSEYDKIDTNAQDCPLTGCSLSETIRLSVRTI